MIAAWRESYCIACRIATIRADAPVVHRGGTRRPAPGWARYRRCRRADCGAKPGHPSHRREPARHHAADPDVAGGPGARLADGETGAAARECIAVPPVVRRRHRPPGAGPRTLPLTRHVRFRVHAQPPQHRAATGARFRVRAQVAPDVLPAEEAAAQAAKRAPAPPSAARGHRQAPPLRPAEACCRN